MTVLRSMPVLPLLSRLLNGVRTASSVLLAATIGIVLLASPTPSVAALLEGETVATTYFRGTAPDMTTAIGPENRVVGPGLELTNFAGYLDIDFFDASILITAMMDKPFAFFDLLRFIATGLVPGFTGVTVNSSTNWAGFTSSSIFFTSDRIDLNLTGLNALQGQRILLDLSGSGGGGGGGGGGGVVSEPSASVLLSIALFGMLGAALRRGRPAA